MKMKMTLAVLSAMTMMAGMAPMAHAADEPPVKDGWEWLMPDGSVVGKCGEGRRPVWSEIPDYNGAARYWVAYSKRGGWKMTYNLTFAEVQEVIANDFIPEHKSNPRLWGYMFNNGNEKVTSNPEVGKLYEGDCILDTHHIPGGENDGKDGVIEPKCKTVSVKVRDEIPAREAVYRDVVTPGKPAVYRTVTKPGRKESNPLVGTFQVDTYHKMSAKYVRQLKADGLLKYREDRAAWNKSKYEFVTIYAKDVAKAGSLTKAINAKTKKVPDLGGNVTAWQFGKGATVAKPWGLRLNVSQRLWTTIKAPAYVSPTKATSVRQIVSQAVPETVERVLVSEATPGQPAVWEDREVCSFEEGGGSGS